MTPAEQNSGERGECHVVHNTDGTFTVIRADQSIQVSDDLLRGPKHDALLVAEGGFVIRAANGDFHYRLTGVDPMSGGRVWNAERVDLERER